MPSPSAVASRVRHWHTNLHIAIHFRGVGGGYFVTTCMEHNARYMENRACSQNSLMQPWAVRTQIENCCECC